MGNSQADSLNEILRKESPVLYQMLSAKGKNAFFPKTGIMKQGIEASGKKINATLGMAFEDDGSPMRLKSIADFINLDPAQVFPYVSSYGLKELRAAWQDSIREKSPSIKGTMSLPLTTNGLTHGLGVTGYMFVDPGEAVIVPTPFWGNYNLVFSAAYGAAIKSYNAFSDGAFNTQGLQSRLSEQKGKQILLFNFPHNPTGYTLTNQETDDVVETLLNSAENDNQIVVILDDAYFGLVYEEGIFQESLFAKLYDLHENILAIKIDGATKEDYAWGLRVGFITYGSKILTPGSCQALEDKTAGTIRGSVSNISHLSQRLILNAIQSENYAQEKQKKYDFLKCRFEKVRETLEANRERFEKVFTPLPFNSGYFMCVKLAPGLEAEKVRRRMLEDFDTGVISIQNIIRIAFSAVPEKEIPALFENIYQACFQELG